jgi:cell division transport system permease protein
MSRGGRALFWTLAFAAFAAAAAGLAARAADRLAAGYQVDISGYAIVRVVDPGGAEGVAKAQAALAHAPHVVSATPMSARSAAEHLRMEDSGEIPIPPLIEITVRPTSPDADVAGDIKAALAGAGVTAEVTTADAPGDLASWVRRVAFWGAIGFAVVMALVVALAARGLAARRRAEVTVMTDLGATKAQAAGRVADEAAILGLNAGLAGAALAAALAVVALMLAVPHLSVENLPAMIRLPDLAPLAIVPIGAAIAAGAGASTAAAEFHDRAARLG